MMQATFPLHLSPAHAAQLVGHCARYRAYAWQMLPPTLERNQTMKSLQAVQGRLSEVQTQHTQAPVRPHVQGQTEPTALVWLMVSEEERQALRQMVSTFMQLAKAEKPSEERTRTLGELAHLRMRLERRNCSTQALERESKTWQI